MATTYTPIATVTLTSQTDPITFSSIPQTYTDLRVIVVGTGTGRNPQMYFNGNFGGPPYNYSNTYLYGNRNTAGNGTGSNLGFGQIGRTNWNSTTPEFCSVDIFSYTNTSIYKTFIATGNQDLNSSGEINVLVNLWRSTAAITSISITSNGFLLNAGTTVTLYGILKA